MNKNVLLIVIISLLLSSCSNINNTEPKKYDISSINFFTASPPKKGENRVYPLALTWGYLVLKNNCIYLTDKKDSEKNLRNVLWPWNYSLKLSKTGIHVMDGKNLVAAKVGSFVKLGGSGGNYKYNSSKPYPKYLVCNNKNVIGAWGASPNFSRPLNFDPSKTRSALQRFMKR